MVNSLPQRLTDIAACPNRRNLNVFCVEYHPDKIAAVVDITRRLGFKHKCRKDGHGIHVRVEGVDYIQ